MGHPELLGGEDLSILKDASTCMTSLDFKEIDKIYLKKMKEGTSQTTRSFISPCQEQASRLFSVHFAEKPG